MGFFPSEFKPLNHVMRLIIVVKETGGGGGSYVATQYCITLLNHTPYRHPESSSRPDFVSVVQQLSLPDTKLLKWSEEDKATDPEAATLGAGLDKAVDLYKDLQKIYVTN